jgi:hypothetical protein
VWRDPATPTGIADHRLAATRGAVASGAALADPRDLVATLRHHGDRPWGRPGDDGNDVAPPPAAVGDDWHGVTVCMHVRQYQVTTASMVTELRAPTEVPWRAWVCLGSPCASVYVPVFPPAVPHELGDAAQWERFARLRDRVERGADALEAIRARLAPVEAELWDEADSLAADADVACLADFTRRAWRPVDAALTSLAV